MNACAFCVCVFVSQPLLESCLTHIHDLAEADLVLILSFVLSALPLSATAPAAAGTKPAAASDEHKQLKTLL